MIRPVTIVLALLAVPALAAPPTKCLPREIRAAVFVMTQRWGPPEIVSTFRRNAVIAGTRHRSYHASCRALDFHPPRGRYREVLAWLRSTWPGGLGTYSGAMHHIHIDTGRFVRFHTYVGRAIAAKKRRLATRAFQPREK